MHISIRSLQGQNLTLEVQPTDTIQTVKMKIQDMNDMRTDRQRLMFDQTSLENGRTLTSYGIGPNVVLQLMEREYLTTI